MFQIVLPIFGAAAMLVAYYSNNQQIEEINAIKSANAIVSKKEDLKEFATLKGVSYTNRGVTSELEVGADNINKVIVPNEKATPGARLLVSKYQKAIDDWYKSTSNPAIPTCTQLETRGKISLSDCNEAKSIDLDLYSYTNNSLGYEASGLVANKIKSMKTEASQISIEDTTTSKSLFVDAGRNTASYDKVKFDDDTYKREKINKLVISELNKDPYKASRINNSLVKLDIHTALNNAIEISKVIEGSPTSFTAQQIKDVAKELKKTELISKNTFLKNVDGNVYSSQENMSNYDSTNLTISQKNLLISNFSTPKLTTTDINNIKTEIINTGELTNSIDSKLNVLN